MLEVEIKCLPADLPSEIIVDVANLQNNQTIHIGDLKIPDKVELTSKIDDAHNPAVLTIHTPTTKEETAEEVQANPEEPTPYPSSQRSLAALDATSLGTKLPNAGYRRSR